MYIVRNSFVAKPGQATKLAGMLKQAAAVVNISNARVLTDAIGDFNQVIFEFEVAELSEFEGRYKEYSTNNEFRQAMAGYTDLWITGKREILQIA